MDMSILSREWVRRKVAVYLLAYPEDGEAGAFRRAAANLNLTEDSVREIVAFVEESTCSE